MPVNLVSFWDATRFANWLHNGQPKGAQDDTTTEDGAYSLAPTGIANDTVTRNVGAEVFVTSNDEWYKAAYYDTGAMIYFDCPAGSDTQTTCTVPGATANTANCDLIVFDLTDAGTYAGAASPTGTFDQGGNVFEWSETILFGSFRGLRGGSFSSNPVFLAASTRVDAAPTDECGFVGFRVASLVPGSPPVPSLSPLGMAFLCSGLGWAALRRRIA